MLHLIGLFLVLRLEHVFGSGTRLMLSLNEYSLFILGKGVFVFLLTFAYVDIIREQGLNWTT